MQVVRPDGAHAFLDLAGPLLERDEARHNLILGIAGTLIERPDAHPVVRTWVALEAGAPVAAALRTPPHNLVLADPATGEALDQLLTAVREDHVAVPGLIGNVPHVHDAARRWCAATGCASEVVLEQGVFALTEVRDVVRPAGGPRPVEPGERDLLVRWFREFLIEALPDPEIHLADVDRSLDTRFARPGTGLWWWGVDGEPVSLAGYSEPTPSGIRIAPVYTPPEHRRRGYATALVGDLSRGLLARGRRFVFLFTDLSNPTSNAIYERIGYRRVADAVEIRFVDRSA